MRKKHKSVSLVLAFRFSILVSIFVLIFALGFSEALWLSIRKQKSNELKNSCAIIQKTMEHSNQIRYRNGFPQIPYYIDYLIYTTEYQMQNESFSIISTNNPYLPNLPETPDDAKSYFEENYYIDGNLNILYYSKKLRLPESTVIIQVSMNMDSDSSTKLINQLPRTLLFTFAPVLLVSFLISLFITKRVMNPVVKMTEKAKKISSSNLDSLLSVRNSGDEIDELALTFNDLFKRLKNDFDREHQFTSDVSHELKTPVAVISGQANLLRRWGKDDPKQLEKSLEVIIRESKSMESIISNLLQMSRIENHKILINKVSVSLPQMFERLKKETLTIHPSAKFTYSIDKADSIFTDEELIHQVFTVIISNTLKYCPEPIEITIEAYKEQKHTVINLFDNGNGFDEKIIPHVFERFYRGDDSHNRNDGGSGLGLSIAKTIIEAMDGKIIASNNPTTKGAMLTIKI